MNSEKMLLYAIEQGEAPVVRSLVNSSTNVLARIAAGDDDALTVLVSEEYYNFSYSPDDYLPLHFAVLRGSSEIVETLLDAGSQVNFANKNSDTPLHLAALVENPEMVKFCLDGAQIPMLSTYVLKDLYTLLLFILMQILLKF